MSSIDVLTYVFYAASSARNLTSVPSASNISVSTSTSVLASSQVTFTGISNSSSPVKVNNPPSLPSKTESANTVTSSSISAPLTSESLPPPNMSSATGIQAASNSTSKPDAANPGVPDVPASETSATSSATPSPSRSASAPSRSASGAQISTDSSHNADNVAEPTPSPSKTGKTSSNQSGSIAHNVQKSADSTSVQVVTNDGPTSTVTTRSTFTGQPSSTLSTPVGVVTTNAFNGQPSTTFPPVVTVVRTTVDGDGSLVTLTDIVANPTGATTVDGKASNDSSFFHNQGAVAGVFLCVGIVVACLVTGLVLLCRRRRKRREKQRQWIASVRRRLPSVDSPFVDQEEDTPMRQVDYYDSTPPPTGVPPTNPERAYDYDPRTPDPATSTFRNAGHDNKGYILSQRPTDPFSDLYAYKHRQTEFGVAVTTDTVVDTLPALQTAQSPSRPSLVQSSPSIYPPTIPLSNDDVSSIYEEVDMSHEEESQPSTQTMPHAKQDSISVIPLMIPTPASTSTPSPTTETPTAFPSRPPRSVLREAPSKIMDYRPLTPPESAQGHDGNDSSTKPPSPIGYRSSGVWEDYPSVEQQQQQRGYQAYTPPSSANKAIGIEDIFNRRTLLGIRPRPSADNVGTR
ncbi:hypothetical protein D9758_000310 [Tetrapyrgos nigripes]|uniref:Uncharacterized protein n=1 Tax=Tetrapyrgos nigripes TaxID=182062 RepID=A0A8H5H1Z8_9AGAR|nr:hypothetical protein D9758_000310 [Tetrapyrgos nigripes]